VHWWGPFGLTNTIESMDARPGGVWRFTMHVGNGQTYPNVIHCHEVVREQKLRFTHGSGVEGEPTFDTEITFEAIGPRKTRVTLQQWHASEARAKAVATYAIPGGKQTFTRLLAYLRALEASSGATLDEPDAIVVERAYDGSSERVLDALRSRGAVTDAIDAHALVLRGEHGAPVVAAVASVAGKTQLFIRSASSERGSPPDARALTALTALLDAVGATLATG
jgi:uncharacterized protein YndB with AHSA1/START domain